MKKDLDDFKGDLTELRRQLIKSRTNSVEACKFFQFLSGKSGNAFAYDIGVSHTYWNDLIRGNRVCPSDDVQMRIAETLGFSYETVKYIFADKEFNFDEIRKLIIGYLENNFKNKELNRSVK